jgi:WD40 repeat protein/tRNA A-37 threonylcarbamoyl transferase component Bud32
VTPESHKKDEAPPSLERLVAMLAALGSAAPEDAPGSDTLWVDEHTLCDAGTSRGPAEGHEQDTWPWIDDEVLNGLLAAAGAGLPCPSEGADAMPREASPFGRYLILHEIDRGGFSVVYLAFDPTLDRRVALKVARPETMANADFRHRFQREGAIASRLDHPNIVTVHDVGQVGALRYIAMAYVEGKSLAHWLHGREAPPRPRQAAWLVRAIAGAVAHAHGRGVLHRDLKPRNILLGLGTPTSADDPGLVPRIADFGFAKILDGGEEEAAGVAMIGSPPYMPPEQVNLGPQACGPSADVYALGVILYELLFGQPPFRGENRLQTLRAVVEDEPVPPSRRRPGIPADLEAVCLKCLEKSPADRYPTADALRNDLDRFLDGRPVSARPAPPLRRCWARVRRHPSHAAVAVLAFALAVVSVTWQVEESVESKQHNAALQKAQDAARRSDERARDQAEQLAGREAAVGRLRSDSQLQLAFRSFQEGDIELALQQLDEAGADVGRTLHAGFAWRYINSLGRRRLTLLRGHTDSVYALAVSPDGRTLATGGLDQTLILWDLATGRPRATLAGHAGPVLRATFSPDGRTLATLASDRQGPGVRLWDMATGREWHGRVAVGLNVFAVSFARDGHTLVTASPADAPGSSMPGGLLAWDLDLEGRIADDLPRPFAEEIGTAAADPRGAFRRFGIESLAVRTAAADPHGTFRRFGIEALAGGRTLAVEAGNGSVRLFDSGSGEQLAVARWGDMAAGFQAISDQRPVLGPTDWERAEASVRLLTGAAPVPFVQTPRGVTAFACSPDGRTLALAGPGWAPTLYDAELRLPIGHYRMGNPKSVRSLCFTPDGGTLIITGDDPVVRLWRLRTPPDPLSFFGHPGEVWGLAFSPDGRTLASAADDHTVRLWDAATGEGRGVLRGHNSLVTDVVFSGDGKNVATAGYDGTVRLWDPTTRLVRATLSGHTDRVRAVAFSPVGATLASAGSDSTIRLWDADTGRSLGLPLIRHNDTIEAIAFSPDGARLVSGDAGKTLVVWDIAGRVPVATWPAPSGVYGLAFSPDGKTLVSGHSDGSLAVRDFPSGKVRLNLPAHSRCIFKVAFDPTGTTLASVSGDHTVKLWDPETGQQLTTLGGHQSPVHALAFAPDGGTLATGDFGGMIKLWRVSVVAEDPEAPATYARLGR